MYEIKTTETYHEWFYSLKDTQGKARINARLRRVELGNFGDAEPVGDHVSELRSFLVQDIAFISYSMGMKLLSYLQVATSPLSRKT